MNNFSWPITRLVTLFDIANKEKLRTAGDELPSGDVFTLYRGVAGKRHFRRVRSFSWTLRLDTAIWFATRFVGLFADPAVYRATIAREDVLAYVDDRNEQEIICRPKRCERLDIPADKLMGPQKPQQAA